MERSDPKRKLTRSWDSDVNLEIVTARKVVFSGEAAELVLPGEEGELCILDFHQPCICRLKNGMVRVKQVSGHDKVNKNELHFFIRRGMAKVGLMAVTLLVEDRLAEAS